MRVGRLARDLGTDLFALARALSERQKEALTLGIAIRLVVRRLAPRNQGVDERPISNANCAILVGISGYRHMRRQPIRGSAIRPQHAFAELRRLAARRFVELFPILGAPPVAHRAAFVEFRSDTIETVDQLVRRQNADSAEID